MEIDEFDIIASDGKRLSGVYWECSNPKVVACIVHGLGEHSGRYQHVAEFFSNNNIAVFSFDLRGHGLSEGKRGHTPSHEQLLDDVEELLKTARAEFNDLPILLFGHSFGGNIVSNYILKRNTNELKGAILSSPWLETEIQPSEIEFKLARFLYKVFPSLTQNNRIDTSWLTKDPDENKKYEDDPLVHGSLSIKLGLDSFDAGKWAIENADQLKIPTLLYHGTDDKITSLSASKRFAEKAGSLVSYKEWEGVRHEPHNDLEKEEILAFVHSWVDNKLTN